MTTCTLTRPHRSEYPQPITFAAGTVLTVGEGDEGDEGGSCPTALSTRTATVELTAPLGDRRLLGCRPEGSFAPAGGYDSPALTTPRSTARRTVRHDHVHRMTTCTLTRPHRSEYPQPVTFDAGTVVTVGEGDQGDEGDEGWEGRCFGEAPGQEGGWVPEQLLELTGTDTGTGTGTAQAREAHTARQLDVDVGDVFESSRALTVGRGASGVPTVRRVGYLARTSGPDGHTPASVPSRIRDPAAA